jgi:hypothetical protein
MRKPIILLAAICIVATMLSCKKIVSAIFNGTDINVPTLQLTIPVILAVTPNEISLGSFSQQINVDSIIRANTEGVFGINAVSSIKLKQAAWSISNADALNNLANFESARVTLQSNSNNTPVEIISVIFPDAFATSYTYVPVSSPELLPYLNGNTLTYTMFGKVRRITNKPLNFLVQVTLRAN